MKNTNKEPLSKEMDFAPDIHKGSKRPPKDSETRDR